MFKKITLVILVGVILSAPGDSLGQPGGGGGRGGGGRGGGGRGNFGGFNFNPSTTNQSSSVIVGTDDAQITLIPYPEKNWIIARAPAEVLKQIEEWITKLDLKETAGQAYDTITVSYVDVDEVASRLNEVMNEINVEIQKNIVIQPLVQSRQLLVFGKDEYREMVKKLVNEIDLPSNQLQRRTFKLKNADPEDIKTKLDELYNMTGASTGTSRTIRTTISRTSSTGASVLSADTVIVTTYPSLRQVVVLASPDNLIQIKKQIDEWDVPIDPEALKPKIIELKNVDPAQMADLLTTLFSESGSSSSGTRTTTNARAMLSAMYGTTASNAERIIGPLFGQLTFADVPGTKKIIVISNIPEAYEVVEALIKDLDEEEMAEIPTVVTLKFADPEKLCEVLNAMFCEAGSSVEILRSASGLSTYTMDDTSSTTQTDTSQDGYTPWWSSAGARTTTTDDERPISNVIGKIRFVPETRTKSVLILSPPEFIPKMEELIAQLDVPGKQVMIKAVIVEIDHKDVSSLGVQMATNPNAFGALEENAVQALNAFEQLDQHGSVIFGAGGNSGTQITNSLSADVYVLLDFLQKKVNAKILNQQTLWTEDNEEASFFKGQRVAFFTSASTSATAGNVQNFEFQKVGMNLAVRPSITPNKDVDMIVNIILSQLTTDEKNGQPVRTEMETKTNMIVGDGQTLMLGGILFQQDSFTKRGVPGLSDLPLLGPLFSHKEKTLSNNELIVFITPYVINESGENSPETQEQIDIPKEKLENIRKELGTSMDKLENMKLK